MADRFERLFQIPDNQYIEGSPVILSAGALLKDNETGSIIAQLKFQSVSEKRIKAVKVSLTAFDISKTEVQGVSDYQYLELNICNGQEFGGNKAIVMPVSVVRSFTLSSIVVVFQDSSIWDSCESLSALPPKNKLSTVLHQSELEKQYRLNTNDHAEFSPNENSGLWQCFCGTWNSGKTCTKCRILKDNAFSAMDVSALTEQMNIRLEKERVQREEAAARQAKLQEEAAAKKAILKKRIKIVIIIALVTALLIGVAATIYAKIHELTIEKMLTLYTKEDVIALLGESEEDSNCTLYDVSFMDEDYSLMLTYDRQTLKYWSLSFSYPGIDKLDSIFDIPDYTITAKDKKAANSVLTKVLESFKEKYGGPQVSTSEKNTTTYVWIVNDRMIELIDYTGNRELSLVSAINIRVNCDHQSFCKHSDIKEENATASCTKDGYDRTICNICGYVDETIYEAFGHKESSKTLKEPTCSAKGEQEFTCSTCGNQRKEEIATIPHSYQDTIIKEATCTTEGSKNQTCSVCNYTTTEEATAALGHDYKQATTKTAGCESTGTYTYTCTRCNDKYNETIAALGHSLSSATCENNSSCSRCGLIGEKAYGHNWTSENWVGGDIYCSHCNKGYKYNIKLVGRNFPCTSKTTYETVTVTGVYLSSNSEAEMNDSGRVFVAAIIGFNSTGEGVTNSHMFTVKVFNSQNLLVATKVLDTWGKNDGAIHVDLPDNDTYYIEISTYKL